MKRPDHGARLIATAALVTLSLFASVSAMAGPREQAKRMHDRLAGVPPSAAVLNEMAGHLPGNPQAAAEVAMRAPSFYNATLKNWITPWTNREQTTFAPLNDYTATVIGMIRDDVDFRQVLSADILYVGGSGLPTYSPTSNALYEQMEAQDLDLGDDSVLVASTQSTHTGVPAAATAGVMTTRAAAQSFFVAGTNRAMFRFTLMAHMCTDLEQTQDISLSTDRIRQDVARSPGGDSRVFLNNCSGCHTGMDPLTQAFAYYNWDEEAGRIAYTPGVVQPKYLINSDNFKPGYVTRDDGWDNYWRKGANRLMGWSDSLPGTGSGAKSMGEELAHSEKFAQCQVEKVFRAVCLRPPVNAADRNAVASITTDFKNNGYRMKRVFAGAAAHCMGD